MDTERLDRWILAGFGLVITLLLALALGVGIPLLLIPEERGNWTGDDAQAALYARVQVDNAAHPLVLRTSVVDIQPDQEGCEWGYPGEIASVVTVRAHTLFGLPIQTWVVDCNGPHPE